MRARGARCLSPATRWDCDWSLREACGDRALSVRRRLASLEASEDDREEAPSTGHTRAVWRHGKCASVGLRYRCSQEAVERSRRGGEQGPRPRRELLKFPRVAGMDAHMTRPGENVREPVESVTGDFQEAFHSGGGGGGAAGGAPRTCGISWEGSREKRVWRGAASEKVRAQGSRERVKITPKP